MQAVKPISVLVFGAGAIGTYVGGTLAMSGHRVVFIEQAVVVGELHKRGLRLDLSIDNSRSLKEPYIVSPASFDIVNSTKEALDLGPFDVAIFAMKSFDTLAALDDVKPFEEKMPPILCLQNGVDNEPTIGSVLGKERVVAGTVTGSIARRAAGDIVLEKRRGIGIVAGHPLSEMLVSALNSAGLNAHLYPRAGDMKWSKVLVNLPGSATAAIVDMTPGEVFSHPGLYALEIRMAREALAVMKAQGVHPVNLPKIPVRALALAMNLPAFLARPVMKKVVGGGRGGKMPSFHIDLHEGRKKSEVAYLHGAVVRYGEKYGVPTPVSRLLTDTLLALVHGDVPINEFSKKPDRLIGLLKNRSLTDISGE